jgi:hypothetical protein
MVLGGKRGWLPHRKGAQAGKSLGAQWFLLEPDSYFILRGYGTTIG